MKNKRKTEEISKEEKILYDFLSRDTVSLAKELLGKLIKVKYGESILSGYIVETEAYLGKEGILVGNGPGKLTKAMGINDRFNMTKIEKINDKMGEICKNILYIDFEGSRVPKKIASSARIGIPDKGIWTGKKLRFYVNGNKYVSGMKKRDFDEDCWTK